MSNPIKDRAYVLTVENAYRLKWHKLLIYCGLWMLGIYAIGLGFTAILGHHYGENKQVFYLLYPNMKLIDVVYGISLILLGTVLIVARFNMAKLLAKGVTQLKICLIAQPIIDFFYLCLAGIVTNITTNPETVIPDLLFSIFWILIIHFYYKKRKDLLEE